MTEKDLHPTIQSTEKIVHFFRRNKDEIYIETICGRTNDTDMNGKIYIEQQIKISETDRYSTKKELVNCTTCKRILKLK